MQINTLDCEPKDDLKLLEVKIEQEPDQEELKQESGRNKCTRSLSIAFSCIGESLRRSLHISKPKTRCKSQEPYPKSDYDTLGSKNPFKKSLSEDTIVSSVMSHTRSKSASSFESCRDGNLQVVIYTGNNPQVKREEMSLVLDCACEVIEEVFHLTAPTNWLRSQGLYLVKTLLRTAYGSVISELIQKTVAELLKEDTICFFLDTIREYVWPNDDAIEPDADEKALTKSKAWNLLMQQTPGDTQLGIGIHRIQSIVGKYNTMIGLTRLFNMLQHEELNRLLAFSFLEALIDVSCIQ